MAEMDKNSITHWLKTYHTPCPSVSPWLSTCRRQQGRDKGMQQKRQWCKWKELMKPIMAYQYHRYEFKYPLATILPFSRCTKQEISCASIGQQAEVNNKQGVGVETNIYWGIGVSSYVSISTGRETQLWYNPHTLIYQGGDSGFYKVLGRAMIGCILNITCCIWWQLCFPLVYFFLGGGALKAMPGLTSCIASCRCWELKEA